MPLAIALLVFAFLLLGSAVFIGSFRDTHGNPCLEAHRLISGMCCVAVFVCLALAAVTA
jgi:hypothetical protein